MGHELLDKIDETDEGLWAGLGLLGLANLQFPESWPDLAWIIG